MPHPEIQSFDICPDCGNDDVNCDCDTAVICRKCNGAGEIYSELDLGDPHQDCDACFGTGYSDY